jgi:hypothetical protein
MSGTGHFTLDNAYKDNTGKSKNYSEDPSTVNLDYNVKKGGGGIAQSTDVFPYIVKAEGKLNDV